MIPSDAVTRDELKSIIEIQSKNVEQLTVIANHLSTIVDRENKIYERLYNGLAKDISAAVNTRLCKIEECMDEAKDAKAAEKVALKADFTSILANSTLSRDMGHIKWFVSIVGVLIVIASVLIGSVNRKEEAYNMIKQFKEQVIDVDYPMSHDLKEHMKTHG